MTDAPVPLPRRGIPAAGDGPLVEAIPIRGRQAVAVLDGPAPPWLRVPSRPRVRLAAVPESAAVPEPIAVPEPAAVVSEPAVDEPGAVHRPAVLRARPRVGGEPDILGLSRRSRGRWGSRLFALFFLAVYALILGQLVFTLVHG